MTCVAPVRRSARTPLILAAGIAALQLWLSPLAIAAGPASETPREKLQALPWLDSLIESQEANPRDDLPLNPASPGGPWWDGFRPPGFNGVVRCAVEFRGDLVVAGDFTTVGSVPIFKIARWDGEAWHDMGFRYSGTAVAMAVYENDLLVSGAFSRFNSGTAVIRFDGTDWTVMGGPLHEYFPVVTDIKVFGDMLLIAGVFTSHGSGSGTRELRSIARWDGSDWAPMVEGEGEEFTGFDFPVYSLIEFEGDLIAGGVFDSYNEDPTIAGVARWNGETWEAIGDSQGRAGSHLAVHEGKLYAGTNVRLSGIWHLQLSEWNGTSWADIADELGSLGALVSWNGKLLASAPFGGAPTGFLHDWDGESWTPWENNLDGHSYEFMMLDNTLLALGSFYHAGTRRAVGFAQWKDQEWTTFGDQAGEGVDSQVLALAAHDGALIAGGYFDRVGTQIVNDLARWDGSAWSPMGDGLAGGVYDLCVAEDGNLYAAGGFFDVGPDQASHAARWDGEAWRALGEGPLLEQYEELYRIVPFQGGLVGIERHTRRKLHVWDGTSWSTMTPPPDLAEPEIQAIGRYGDRLVVTWKIRVYNGGSFPSFYLRVYAYDGSEWENLDYPFTPRDVHAVYEVDGKLFLGTSKNFGPEGEPYYTGRRWLELPVNPHVEHAQVFGWLAGGLVVAGSFGYDWDESDVLGIARLEGDTWVPLGDFGITRLEDLEIFRGDLYVGGWFSQVNGGASGNIARLLDASVPVELLNVGAARVAGGAEIHWEVASFSDHAGFHVYREDGEERIRLTDRLLAGATRYQYLDPGAPPEEIEYWIQEHSRSGETEWHGPIPLSAITSRVPVGAFPNPFRSSTSVQFALPLETEITVRIFDLRGRQVRTLLEGVRSEAGENRVDWSGNDDSGRTLPAGVYFYVVEAPAQRWTGRLVKMP